MRIDKPLWYEGLILNQQQFQQQDRWTDFVHRQFASAAIAEPWGTLEVAIDEEALPNGRLRLTRLKLRFPDGTLFDTSVSDVLPSARDLAQGLSPDTQSVVVLAALPLVNATGSNCRFDETALARPRRSYREFVKVTDLNGTDEAEIAAERHAVRLLFDFEQHADDTVCAIARLTRGTGGHFQVDHRYVPPCLTLAGHPLHVERAKRLADILRAKSVALGARKSERMEASCGIRRRRRVVVLAAALHSHILATAPVLRHAPESTARAPLFDARPTGQRADDVFDRR